MNSDVRIRIVFGRYSICVCVLIFELNRLLKVSVILGEVRKVFSGLMVCVVISSSMIMI